jgi:hypothetical protein
LTLGAKTPPTPESRSLAFVNLAIYILLAILAFYGYGLLFWEKEIL